MKRIKKSMRLLGSILCVIPNADLQTMAHQAGGRPVAAPRPQLRADPTNKPNQPVAAPRRGLNASSPSSVTSTPNLTLGAKSVPPKPAPRKSLERSNNEPVYAKLIFDKQGSTKPIIDADKTTIYASIAPESFKQSKPVAKSPNQIYENLNPQSGPESHYQNVPIKQSSPKIMPRQQVSTASLHVPTTPPTVPGNHPVLKRLENQQQSSFPKSIDKDLKQAVEVKIKRAQQFLGEDPRDSASAQETINDIQAMLKKIQRLEDRNASQSELSENINLLKSLAGIPVEKDIFVGAPMTSKSIAPQLPPRSPEIKVSAPEAPIPQNPNAIYSIPVKKTISKSLSPQEKLDDGGIKAQWKGFKRTVKNLFA